MPDHAMKLEPRLSASDVEVFQDEMLAHLEKGGDIVLNASRVELIDTPVVQVLLGLKQQSEKSMQALKIEDPSDGFREALDLLGVAPELIGEDV